MNTVELNINQPQPILSEYDEKQDNGNTKVLTRPESKTKKPKMFQVLLLNDDFTPMDFVIEILSKFFHKNEIQATEIMLQVHRKGSGVAGVYTFEVAETKTYLVNNFSKQHQFPLKCIMEES